jgi:hypothetical protein
VQKIGQARGCDIYNRIKCLSEKINSRLGKTAIISFSGLINEVYYKRAAKLVYMLTYLKYWQVGLLSGISPIISD